MFDPADADALLKLQRVIYDADGGSPPSREDIELEWIGEEAGFVRSLQVWTDGDQLIAAIGVWHESADPLDRAYGMTIIHPEWRTPEVLDTIVTATISAATELIDRSVSLYVGCIASANSRCAAMERAGFLVDTIYHRMCASDVRLLQPSPLLEGFIIRPLAGTDDIDTWVRTINAAFADQHEPTTTSTDEKRRQMHLASYLPTADLVALDSDGSLVGIGLGQLKTLEDGSLEAWV
ncbi:MAG TPA: hypothetical protein PK819_02200, partial [Thermomicrobiales bacterium]|nr:hypothetical protein [Thermomicrobiales bacterium]